MAAESASLSTALDRHLYVRVLLESILYGEPDYGADWRHKLRVPGILVTDARSLYDHLGKTGSVPKERQTLIDLLVARDLVEAGTVILRWVPTTHMLADILTKTQALSAVFRRLVTALRYSLKPTVEEVEVESHRQKLRQQQRQRRKERNEAARSSQAP